MLKALQTYYKVHPLRFILIAALFIRMLAVIFSKGFGWIDDQFLVIEIAQSWISGGDYYHWLPGTPGSTGPMGFSFFYVGLHYLFFQFLELVNIFDPQTKMLFVRLVHALWSLLTVYFGFKITCKLSNLKTARQAAWVLSIFWMFPFLSIRNLIEFVSVPPMMWGLWLLVNNKSTKWQNWLWAGLLFGLAFNIRLQSGIFTLGLGIVLLLQKKWKTFFVFGLAGLFTIALIQGGIDFFVWGKPFVQLETYVQYNMAHSGDYITNPWFTYILFLLGVLVPPVSIFLFIGFFKAWRKHLILFLPILLFLILHSYYPNKQERFVVTIIPFFIIIGLMGWQEIVDKIQNAKLIKAIKISWIFFWVVNLILLLPVSTMYSKKARVESMVYLSHFTNLQYYVIEDSHNSVLRTPPQFYLKKWIHFGAFMRNDDFEQFKKKKDWNQLKNQADFVLFVDKDHLGQRVKKMREIFPALVYDTVIMPGNIDKVMQWLNPYNDNHNIYIYRNMEKMPPLNTLKHGKGNSKAKD